MDGTKTISKNEVLKMPLKGKPKCPVCHTPLSYVYEGSTGYTAEKCLRCMHESLVDTETLEVYRIDRVKPDDRAS